MQIIRAYDRAVDSLVFAPDGRAIASAGDSLVRLHSLESGALLGEWPGSVVWAPLAFTPEGTRLVRGGIFQDGGLRIWPIDGTGPVIEVPGFFPSVAVSPGGRTIATNSGDFNRWDLESGKQLPPGWSGFGTALPGGRFPAGGVAYSPDGRIVATAHGEQRGDEYRSVIFFWDARTGQQLGEMVAGFTQEYPRTIAYSPDGNTLAAVSGPMLQAWDTRSRRELVTRKTSRKHFQGLAFTPDGRRLITVSNDKTARLWDCSTWTEVGGYEWKIGKLRSVAVSLDGLRFAAGGDSGKIVIWDNDT